MHQSAVFRSWTLAPRPSFWPECGLGILSKLRLLAASRSAAHRPAPPHAPEATRSAPADATSAEITSADTICACRESAIWFAVSNLI